jgi:hypothetical protein
LLQALHSLRSQGWQRKNRYNISCQGRTFGLGIEAVSNSDEFSGSRKLAQNTANLVSSKFKLNQGEEPWFSVV